MIIKGAHKESLRHRAWHLWGLELALLVLLVWLLWPQFGGVKKQKILSNSDAVVFCSAENTEGAFFLTKEYEIEGAQFQSDDIARTGTKSVFLPANGKGNYAFNVAIEQISAGEVWMARVWRKSKEQAGVLTLRSFDGSVYLESKQSLSTSKDGWESLEIVFVVPDSLTSGISFYVYNHGDNAVYFDDFEIKRLGKISDYINVLKLHIPTEANNQIRKVRDKALKKGLLLSEDNRWVNARILTKERDIPVKMRLKGDWTDHLDGDQWSFRIKTKKGTAWNGMTIFSIQRPAARYYLHEWILHQFWQKAGVLTPRYSFVHVFINGNDKGVYALEEHFTRQLLESQHRREAPIVKFSESGFWAGMQRQLENHGFQTYNMPPSAMSEFNATVDVFDQDKMMADTTLRKLVIKGIELLSSFQQNTKPVQDVFDLDLMAKYYAIVDIMHADHGKVWHNQRFYYNPVTALLEPIGYDGFAHEPGRKYQLLGEAALNPDKIDAQSLFVQLFDNEDFVAKYIEYLFKFSSHEYFSSFLKEYENQWLILKQQMDASYHYELNDLLQQAAYIHSLVLPFDNMSIKAALLDNDELQLKNTHYLPIKILGLTSEKGTLDVPQEQSVVLAGHTNRRYLDRLQRDSLIRNFGTVKYLHEEALLKQHMTKATSVKMKAGMKYVVFKVLGVDSMFYTQILTATKADTFQSHPLAFNKTSKWYTIKGNRLYFKMDILNIDAPIVIPTGYRVYIMTGTEIILKDGAYIESKSPVLAEGSAEHPILIRSENGKGITLLNTNSSSSFDNIIFQGLSADYSNGYLRHGGVNIYQAEVDFKNCNFLNAQSEDALNIIRSEFTINQCHFQNTFSDAFDSDFSKGELRNCTFKEIGNDAMDFSGSIVNVFDTQIAVCGDKGLSVGEESDVMAENVQVSESSIAFVSKDFSVLVLKKAFIQDCPQAFAAYQKKPEYGGAKIIVESFKSKNINKLYTLAPGSLLQLKDRVIYGN